MTTAAQLRREAEQAARIAAELADQAARATAAEAEARKPKMPAVAEQGSTVVAFEKYQSGRRYHYAAVGWRDGRHVRWMITGMETRRFNWPGLLAWIGESNWHTLSLPTGWEAILAPEVGEPPVAETMGRYGRVRTIDTVSPFVDGPIVGDAHQYGL